MPSTRPVRSCRPLWFAVAGAVMLLDQWSKAWILELLATGENRVLTPFFNLVLVHNQGAAFSMLSDAAGWQRGLFSIIALGISAWIAVTLWRHPARSLLNGALSLILGGAVGNLTDRLMRGAVVDFLDFHWLGHHWPAFNVADSAITVGAVLLVLDTFISGRRPQGGTHH